MSIQNHCLRRGLHILLWARETACCTVQWSCESTFVQSVQEVRKEPWRRRQLFERGLQEVEDALHHETPPPDAEARSEAALQALLVSAVRLESGRHLLLSLVYGSNL